MSVEEIKHYWEERAAAHTDESAATTNDVYLRELEAKVLICTLNEIGASEGGTLLDVGCGDGHSMLKVAAAVTRLRFYGVDYSPNMILNAWHCLESAPELRERVSFAVGDATDLSGVCGKAFYDVVVTDRCLINLGSLEAQHTALKQIAEHTKEGGHYIAIENFVEGNDNLNAARQQLGLPSIPMRWHNRYFREDEFLLGVRKNFEVLSIKDFSSAYYFATRVVYSAMCQMRGEKPDYQHEIHRLAVDLPWTGQFSPIRMIVLLRI